MSNSIKVGLAVIAALVIGFFGAKVSQPLLGGDFAGGITPSQLFTANAGTNTITPILSNIAIPGSVAIGGTSAANQITAFYTATTSYPTAAVNLGSITNATSATSTTVSFAWPGFAIGDYCNVSYNGATTTAAFGADGFITSYNTSTNQATATVTFWNGSVSAITLTVTSTVTGVSSTLKATCYHTGV